MMITIICPSCGTEGSQSLLEPNYEGPYRCWKCRELFSIKIEGNEERRQIEELKAKFRKPPQD